MSNEAKSETGSGFQVSTWLKVMLAIIAVLGLGYGLTLLLSSQIWMRSVNQRNFHLLDVASRNLEEWPRDIAGIAKSKFNSKEERAQSLKHPDLGSIGFEFNPDQRCDPKAPTSSQDAAPSSQDTTPSSQGATPPPKMGRFEYFEPGSRASEGVRYVVAGKQQIVAGKQQEFCFKIAVPLDRLIKPGFEDSAISHFLIVAADGYIVQQIGEPRLPINRLDALVPTGGLARSVASWATSADNKPVVIEQAPVIPASLRDVATIDVAGTRYLAYAKPLKVDSPQLACPTEWREHGIKEQADKFADQCFAVALMPAQELRQGWLSASPLPLVFFGLALLIFIALLPLIRLLMIGGAEAVSPYELAGIVAGVPAAAVFVTIGILFADTVATHRAQAREEARNSASVLAKSAAMNIDAPLRWIATSSAYPVAANDATLCGRGRLGLPKLETVFFVNGKGGPIKGLDPKECGGTPPNFTDISFRDYFQAMQRGRTLSYKLQDPKLPEIDYTLGQVRAQTDGLDRTAILVRCPDSGSTGTCNWARGKAGAAASAKPTNPAEPAKEAPGSDMSYILLGLQLDTLIAPILPEPQHFMVVDGSALRMPVLFHTARSHAGVENFLDESDFRTEDIQRLRLLTRDESATSRPVSFVARYSGKKALFAAARIEHTPWLVLVWSDLDSVDQVAARAAGFALTSWATFAVIMLVIIGVCVLIWNERWRQYWPHRAGDSAYVHVRNALSTVGMVSIGMLLFGPWGAVAFLVLSIVIFILWLALRDLKGPNTPRALVEKIRSIRIRSRFDEVSDPAHPAVLFGATIVLAFALSLASSDHTRVLAALVVLIGTASYLILVKNPGDTDEPLSPATERHFVQMMLAIILCMGVVPAVALWQDGLGLSTHLENDERVNAAERSFDVARDRATSIRDSLDLSAGSTEQPRPPIVGLDEDGKAAKRWPDYPWGYSKELHERAFGFRYSAVSKCPPPPPGKQAIFCKLSDDGSKLGVIERPAVSRPWLSWHFAAITLLLLLAIGFMWWLVDRALAALAGFRVPLGAIKPTGLKLPVAGVTIKGERELPRRRTLLVAPQQVVRDRIADYPKSKRANLAEIFLSANDAQLDSSSWVEKTLSSLIASDLAQSHNAKNDPRPLLIITGLELVLRNGKRRRAALLFCESAERALVREELRAIVLIAEMSPLERILDAFDTNEEGDVESRSVREELRWARFFETFTTVTFSPVDKLGPDDKVDKLLESEGMSRYDPPAYLARELRWLPGNVVDATIEEGVTEKLESAVAANDFSPGGITQFPVASETVQEFYRGPIVRWATSFKIPSKEAAFDYMRSTLIEHYEQCWAASTRAERLALDALARGNFINIRNTIALQSLVRRGLVVLDPSPRLMNRSFGLFIQQAERPDRLDDWRLAQPRSRWRLSRWPILAIAPVAAIILAVAAAESGQDLTALISLLAAGAPALFHLLMRTVRG